MAKPRERHSAPGNPERVTHFYAVVHKDDDSAFGVSFPDLPGCFSAADTEADVLPNACEALDLWFEDTEDVDPRPVDQIREAVKDDLAAGAFLMAVPASALIFLGRPITLVGFKVEIDVAQWPPIYGRKWRIGE